MKRVIAIDGPAASGKSTVARRLAAKINFAFANSGNFYRALTWQFLKHSIDPTNASEVDRLLSATQLSAPIENQASVVLVNGTDPGDALYSDGVNAQVSAVAALPQVRSFLLDRLRALADEADLVMEGRDIGSVVFPDAWRKFYLDASPEVRRQRRAAQGLDDEISARDLADSTRSVAPLKIADDAQIIDTSHLDIDAVVAELIRGLAEAAPSEDGNRPRAS